MDTYKKLTEDFIKGLNASFEKKEVKELLTSIKEAGEDTGTFRVLITNEAVDRAGEMIKADGWDFGPYMKSPVVLWGHDYKLPPIGLTLSLTREGNGWVAEGKFAPTPFAQEIRKLYDLKMQRASSVGFIPKEQEGNIITKAELLEWSFVSVPCNAEALSVLSANELNVEDLVAKGIITKEVETKTTEPIVEETEEKGEVSDMVEEEEMRDEKWEKMEPFHNIICAFMDVYYNTETKPEAFNTLLSETISLLQGLLEEGDTTEETEKTVASAVKNYDKTALTKFIENAKKGLEPDQKVTSDVELALSSAKALTVALEGLLVKEGSERNEDNANTTSHEVKEAAGFLELKKIMQCVATTVSDGLAQARKNAEGLY